MAWRLALLPALASALLARPELRPATGREPSAIVHGTMIKPAAAAPDLDPRDVAPAGRKDELGDGKDPPHWEW